MAQVKIDYFSDVLCIWAYVAQIRLDELKENFTDQIEVQEHFITLFGNTEKRIAKGWADRGGYEGFNKHVIHVAEQFPHSELNQDVWLKNPPKSSAPSHLYLKALQLLVAEQQLDEKAFIEFIWQIRCAFFQRAEDISHMNTLHQLAESQKLSIALVEEKMNDGSALAALCSDMEMKEQFKLEGSPTYLLNNGRQKLYGNVGYRVLEANVQELIERPEGIASWC